MKLIKSLFLASFILTLAMSENPVTPPKFTTGVEINFKDLEIEDFVKMVAKITNKNILLTTEIKGKINFVSVKPIEKDKLYELLLQILETRGFTIVETKAGFLNLVRNTDAGGVNLPIKGDGVVDDKWAELPQMVTKIIRINSENVDIVTSKVRHLLSKSAKLVTSKEINSIIISEYPENIATIEKIIYRLENTPKIDIKFVELKNEKAATILADITKIATTMFNQQVDEEKMQVLKNDATNSLILIGKRDNISKLIPYIEKLDQKNEITVQKVIIIPLRNSETKDILPIVTTIVSKKVYKINEDRPTITADNSLNAIVAMGLEKDLEEIKDFVEKLDRERQQVYVKAKIIEISDNKLNEFGMKYGLLTTPFLKGSTLFSLNTILGDGTNLVAQAIEAAATIPGFDVKNVLQEKTKTEYVETTVTDTALSGATSQHTTTEPRTVTYTAAPDFGLAVSLSLLDASGATNKLSEPSILCINNEESSIYVGETRRVSAGSVVGTTTQNLTRIEDIGLTLKIKPRLSNDEKVTLQVSAKLEDTIPGSTQDGTTKREVATKAIVRNGESVILGGLIRDSIKGSESKVPLLGDIPVVGDLLFKHSTKNIDKINLVIILTPYIIDSSADLTEFKNQLASLNKIESDYANNVLRILGIKKDEQVVDMKKSNNSNNSNNNAPKGQTNDPFSIITPNKD